jgi:(1->4)-alpha-D-glucan 1-alpha-D-glucosylmutase
MPDAMIATYRLQLHPEFRFEDVQQLLPYYQKLGVSHLYLSPITKARAGSSHGYDVIDHNAINDDLGGREGFDRLRRAAVEAGLEIVIDYVPNHAGVGPRNAYWQDVLAHGPFSPYADFFDIDWNPLKPELQGKILLPFLGRPYGEALDEGELTIGFDSGRFFATYYDNRYALMPASYHLLLRRLLPTLERQTVYWDLKDLLDAYQTIQPGEREKAEALKPRLVNLAERLKIVPEDLEPHHIHEILERQYWRLSYWKTAGYEINYRRFFDINELVALRMEDPQVFWDAHRLLGHLLAQEGIAGVRIDHVDGLFDPHAYLERLRDLGARSVWVEKILAPGETLPADWPVEGTTGYEFMNDAVNLLLDEEGFASLERTYRRAVPDARTWDEEVYRAKLLVMGTSLSSELFRLSYVLDRISEADYHTRDFTLEALREALMEIVAAIGRYRTYLPHHPEEAREVLQHAIHLARQRNPAAEPSVYDFIARVALGEVQEDLHDLRHRWVARFQQYTAPVAAKGVEDTGFYRYLPLVALNEVGGEPEHAGISIQAFHSHSRFRAHRYPRNLVATATHDHKRGEDTRVRLVALSEVPDLWDKTLQTLAPIADTYQRDGAPTRADIYLFYQILVSQWEGSDRENLEERICDYMVKASRESKLRTSWLNEDQVYEEALLTLVRGVLNDPRTPEAIGEVARTLALLGFRNSISQQVLKMTTPGVPDIYQGTELLDLSLVDPDNRRPVDYDVRLQMLEEIDATTEIPAAWLDTEDERAKFFVMRRILALRQSLPDVFLGGYQSLDVDDDPRGTWIAFLRHSDTHVMLAAIPRLSSRWEDGDRATLIIPGDLEGLQWQDAWTDSAIEMDGRLSLETSGWPWKVLVAQRKAPAD